MRTRLYNLAALAAGLVLIAPAAQAAPTPSPKPTVGVTPRMNANPLNLTTAQQDKIRAITSKMVPELQAAMNKAKTDAERGKALPAIQKKYEAQFMAVLTPAQRTKAKAMQADAIKRMKADQARAKAAAPKR